MTDKKRNIIALGALAAVACMGIVCAIPLSMNSINPSKADETEYTIIFNNEKNVISTNTTSSTVKSEKGASFEFFSENLTHDGNIWQKVSPGGYFCTYGNDTTHKNAIHDMKTIYFDFTTQGSSFSLLFSRDGSFENGHYWSKSYTSKLEGQTIDFEGHPRYFRFESKMDEGDIGIREMKITYGCGDGTKDTDWDKKHGINPYIDTESDLLIYGLYPQTHVTSPSDALINAGAEKADEEYFWFEDEYYVKDTANPFDAGYLFSDNVAVGPKGTVHYFKCEPIKFHYEKPDTNYLIDSSNILYANRFAASSNAYANSELRTWLNGDFYNKAFFLNNNPIKTTDLTDVGVTGDKVWIGSKDQYTNWYSSEDLRKKTVTDFALCNYAEKFLSNSVGNYWSRSVFVPTTMPQMLFVVDWDGEISSSSPDNRKIGITPCLSIGSPLLF